MSMFLLHCTCPVCQHKFTSQTALCDDRTDINKNLGCPNCGTFLVDKDRRKRLICILAIVPFCMFVGYFLSKLLGANLDNLWIQGGTMIGLVLFFAVVWREFKPLRENNSLIPSGHKIAESTIKD